MLKENELTDLLTWVDTNFPSINPKSALTYDFWDTVNWKLYNALSVERDETVAKLFPMCRILMEFFKNTEFLVDLSGCQGQTAISPGSQTNPGTPPGFQTDSAAPCPRVSDHQRDPASFPADRTNPVSPAAPCCDPEVSPPFESGLPIPPRSPSCAP